MTGDGVTVVIPTLGRPSLTALLAALAAGRPCPLPMELLLVDDRPDRRTPLPVPPGAEPRVLPGRAGGPAAARNIGWRAARYEWVAFLDDDVLPDPDWALRLAADIASAPASVGGIQGNLRVPLPGHRRPTDWERVTAGLADGAWITADMAYRRAALAACGGFDERLPRAFREDAELAYRVRRAGWSLRRGRRRVTHPVRPENFWISVRTQRGNADDVLLRRLYGPYWRSVLEIPPGRRPRHVAITAAGLAALAAGVAAMTAGRRGAPAGGPRAVAAGGRRAALAGERRGWTAVAAVAGVAWAAGTAEFAAARIAPGPRTSREVATMLVTSVVIPPAAVAHWLRGWWRWRDVRPPADAGVGTSGAVSGVTPHAAGAGAGVGSSGAVAGVTPHAAGAEAFL